MVVVVVLEGEDVGVRIHAQEGFFEGAGFIDYFIEKVFGGYAGLAFHHEEGVGLDEDYVEFVVVVSCVRTGDADTEGYLLRIDEL